MQLKQENPNNMQSNSLNFWAMHSMHRYVTILFSTIHQPTFFAPFWFNQYSVNSFYTFSHWMYFHCCKIHLSEYAIWSNKLLFILSQIGLFGLYQFANSKLCTFVHCYRYSISIPKITYHSYQQSRPIFPNAILNLDLNSANWIEMKFVIPNHSEWASTTTDGIFSLSFVQNPHFILAFWWK